MAPTTTLRASAPPSASSGSDDKLRNLWRLKPSLKVEGIAVERTFTRTRVMVVTDADDPKIPARLLATSAVVR